MRAVLLMAVLALSACTTTPPAPQPVTITLERTPCFGACPVYSVTITGDGAVTYEGRRFVGVTGVQHDQVVAAEVARLVERIHRADFFALRDAYHAPITDLPSARVIVVEGDRRKSVEDYAGEQVGMPHAVREIEAEIDRLANTARWTQRAGPPKLE